MSLHGVFLVLKVTVNDLEIGLHVVRLCFFFHSGRVTVQDKFESVDGDIDVQGAILHPLHQTQ